jgi:hypothetical protein
MRVRTNRIERASQLGFLAVAISKEKGIPLTEAAREAGTSRANATLAKLILEIGSPEDIENAKGAKLGLRTIGQKLRDNMTPEIKAKIGRRTGKKPASYLAGSNAAATLWAKLRPSLQNLSNMPDPRDVVEAIRGFTGHNRIKTTDKHLDIALKWLEEFKHAWDKSTDVKDHITDSRGSGKAFGAQQTKQAAE